MYISENLNAEMFRAKCYLLSAEKELVFWSDKEMEYKGKYGTNPTIPEMNHIKAVKKYKKKAKTEFLYWQAELGKLEKKNAMYQLLA